MPPYWWGATPYQTNTRARGNPGQNKSRRNQTYSKNKNIKSGNNPIPTEVPVIAVLFVEQTAGGELARRLQEAETRLGKMTGYRIRIAETSGSQLCRVLPNTNPWAGGDCGRVGRYTCSQRGENLEDCKRRNVLYKSVCMECNKEDEDVTKKKKKLSDISGVDAAKSIGQTD